jgi:hypothetical protein
MLRSDDDAAEVVQEAFLAAYRHLPETGAGDDPGDSGRFASVGVAGRPGQCPAACPVRCCGADIC